MKKTIILVSTFFVCLLSSCSNGTKVSYEQMEEEIDKIEFHQYKSATLKMHSSGDLIDIDNTKLQEDIQKCPITKKVVLSTIQSKGTSDVVLHYSYNSTLNCWENDEPEGSASLVYVESILNRQLLSYYNQSAMESQASELNWNGTFDYKYYINPFKVVFKSSYLFENSQYVIKRVDNVKGSLAFDKYGHYVSDEYDLKIDQIIDSKKLAEDYKKIYSDAYPYLVTDDVVFDASGITKLYDYSSRKVSISYK